MHKKKKISIFVQYFDNGVLCDSRKNAKLFNNFKIVKMKSRVKKENPRKAVTLHLSEDAPNRADAFAMPSKWQHDFCLANYEHFREPAVLNAANIVMIGYMSQEKVQNKYLHIVTSLYAYNP